MWSPYYKYYQIRKDKLFSELVSLELVEKIVLANNEVIAIGSLEFQNRIDFPWFSIALLKTETGNYRITDTSNYDEINLITMITLREEELKEKNYLKILKSISQRLNWEIILEEDDNGNEDILIK